MFKIPKWEDDVPKSKIDFGKTNKAKKEKATISQLPQKQPKKQLDRLLQTDKKNIKNPLKHKYSANNNGSYPKTNGFKRNKVSTPKNPLNSNNNKHKKIQYETNSGTIKNNSTEFKGRSNGDVTDQKKKSKKRKFDDSITTKKNNKPDAHSSKTSSDSTPSKAKKKKLDNNVELPEGSILLPTTKKKKKAKQIENVMSENGSLSESKVDQKKERFRQLLQLDRNKKKKDAGGNNLRQRMLERLKSAQFRFLNEKLYTTSGSEAQQLFQSDPEAFHTYHQGYQQQVKKWPVNPLDLIVKRISKMPKSHTIADMGCGEAALARAVPQAVRSFDLVAGAGGVEPCDMAHTPLLASATDVVVFCLALMGTGLTQYLLEANRVMKIGGHLLIAEVESRFDNVERFTEDVQRLGFKLKNLDKTHQVFFFMEFVKVRDPPAKKSKLPALSLKPCLYKRR